MFVWIPYAFVRIVVFFIAGILMGLYMPISFPVMNTVVLLMMLSVCYVALTFFGYRLNKNINPGFVGLMTIIVAGFLSVQLCDVRVDKLHVIHEGQEIKQYMAVVTTAAQQREKTWKAVVDVTQVCVEAGWKKASGKVMVYFSKNDFSEPPAYGDELLIKGAPRAIEAPTNPGEFDYKAYLATQSVYHQHFLREGDCVAAGNKVPNHLMSWSIDARLWAASALQQYISDERELGIATALVLGVTDGLDRELMTAYGATGTLHVLAVSGLHISIIYIIIGWLLAPLNKSARGKWIVAIISLVILWSYAFITGLSPSVLRAVTMFSFVALAKPWKQRLNIYNTLAASAFFLLLFDPMMILSVGFQLSYIAVLGIVYLQPKLYAWYSPDSRILDEIWKLTSVSIAAQIATLPLVFYYFHQFPNYFIISNLLVIPVSFIVLIAGIVLLAFSAITVVAKLVAWIVIWSIKLMNVVVFSVEKLPWSTTEDIFVTVAEAILLAMLLIIVLILLERKKFSYVVMTTMMLLTLVGIHWLQFFDHANQRKMVVYDVKGHSALDFYEGTHATFVADTTMMRDAMKIGFHLKPSRLLHGIEVVDSVSTMRLIPGGKLFIQNHSSVLIINHRPENTFSEVEVDYLIIENNAIRSLKDLGSLKARKIIVDSSNSFYLAERLDAEAKMQNVDLFAVPLRGCFQETIML